MSLVPQPETVKADLKAKYDLAGRSIIARYQSGLAECLEEIVRVRPPELYWMQHKIDTAFRLGGFSREDHLLEVGCTAGHYTLMLARDGYRITGLDISSESIQAATLRAQTHRLPNLRFVAADVDNMTDIGSNTFDGAFSFSTLRYVPDPVRSLREIGRVVRPGGRVVIDFPNKYCPWFSFLKFLLGGHRHIHDHTYSTAEARRMMRQAGFVDIEVRRIFFFAKQFPSALVPLYKTIDFVGERLPGLDQFAGIIMCKGIKR